MKGLDYMTKYTIENATEVITGINGNDSRYNILNKSLKADGYKLRYIDISHFVYYYTKENRIIALIRF